MTTNKISIRCMFSYIIFKSVFHCLKMHRWIVFCLIISLSNSCFQVRKLNECGCFDYKPLTINHVAILDKELAQEIRIGNLTTPIYTYENCDYIYIQCGEENARTRQLLRTNWPDRGTIYKVDMTMISRTAILWFKVECDKKSHDWRYILVDDDREIVNEHLVCHSVQ
ncbi:DUF4377 domain-containing protein [Caenorhabditis elegans]|uniref:DUF4377 domain-containing protein n=1 Tax=Caenorhabditis elegans TaxID=6239 RepID=D5MCP2_CAEEL|nr:DUF4377 domain-containing protein [Caenorhabditis elegans]CCD61578.1 DUF4377 domain-containing protein [Caenorhabditis elegans]|eukprot:NP_001249840.1 Uncharacterized protein CELE_B0261.9 [Caenorhabditis elegans]